MRIVRVYSFVADTLPRTMLMHDSTRCDSRQTLDSAPVPPAAIDCRVDISCERNAWLAFGPPAMYHVSLPDTCTALSGESDTYLPPPPPQFSHPNPRADRSDHLQASQPPPRRDQTPAHTSHLANSPTASGCFIFSSAVRRAVEIVFEWASIKTLQICIALVRCSASALN